MSILSKIKRLRKEKDANVIETLRAYKTLITTVNERDAREWLLANDVRLWRLMGKTDVTADVEGASFFLEIAEGDDHLCGWCHWQGNAHGTLWCPDCGDLLVINRFHAELRTQDPGIGKRWPHGKKRRDGTPIE